MISCRPNWNDDSRDESADFDAEYADPMQDPRGAWNELDPGRSEDDIWDVFKLDDAPDDPGPEYGDFWLDSDTDEMGGFTT